MVSIIINKVIHFIKYLINCHKIFYSKQKNISLAIFLLMIYSNSVNDDEEIDCMLVNIKLNLHDIVQYHYEE
jgi:hypothetical protein